MIVLITYEDPKTKILYVSHGVEQWTMRNVVLQQIPLSCYKHKYDKNVGYYLPDDDETQTDS